MDCREYSTVFVFLHSDFTSMKVFENLYVKGIIKKMNFAISHLEDFIIYVFHVFSVDMF